MKITTPLLLLSALFSLSACLDYADPGQELGPNEVIVDDVIYQGNADKINYRIHISDEGAAQAVRELDTKFSQALGGEYALRGGKEAQYPAAHAYQRQFSLGPDLYAQYFVVPHKDFMYGTLNSTYNVSREFNPGPNSSFEIAKNAIVPLINHPLVDSIPEIKAVNLLLYDLAAQEVADIYGPLPYVDYKGNKTANPYEYNDLRTIYVNIVANIDTIVACLRHYETARSEGYKQQVQQVLEQYTAVTQDIFQGKQGFDTWIRFANSLKLRMAMRSVKADPALAQQWAEQAVSDGVIETLEQQVGLFPMFVGFDHPLILISESWADVRMSASLEVLLRSLGHPAADHLFMPNSDVLINQTTGEQTPPESRVVGLRSGVFPGTGQSYANNMMVGYSRLNPEEIAMCPLYIVKLAEVEFLRAEGALRGWNMGGTAEQFYRQGIEHASPLDPMLWDGSWYQQALETYINQESATPYVYEDPMGLTPTVSSPVEIGVKWNEGDSRETKLEKIITQKYIALFPCSFEPWADLRRTGYPRLLPVLNPSDGDGSLLEGQMIRRQPFPGDDDATLSDIQETGLKALGGPDQQATRLWWDVDAPNF